MSEKSVVKETLEYGVIQYSEGAIEGILVCHWHPARAFVLDRLKEYRKKEDDRGRLLPRRSYHMLSKRTVVTEEVYYVD